MRVFGVFEPSMLQFQSVQSAGYFAPDLEFCVEDRERRRGCINRLQRLATLFESALDNGLIIPPEGAVLVEGFDVGEFVSCSFEVPLLGFWGIVGDGSFCFESSVDGSDEL